MQWLIDQLPHSHHLLNAPTLTPSTVSLLATLSKTAILGNCCPVTAWIYEVQEFSHFHCGKTCIMSHPTSATADNSVKTSM